MASSDSEGFESADEEIINEPGNGNGSNLSFDSLKNEKSTHVSKELPESIEGIATVLKLSDTPSVDYQMSAPTSSKSSNDTSINKSSFDTFNYVNGSDTGNFETLSSINNPSVPSTTLGKSNLEGWDIEDEDGLIISEQLETKIKNTAADCSTFLKESEQQGSGGGWSAGWSSWGVSSILSTATESVTNFTRISSGITSALGTGLEGLIESSLGAPDPVDLAKSVKEKEACEEPKDTNIDSATSGEIFGLSSIIGNVSTISTKVISGGLDTLENLGKKTMEVLQDGDPGLKKKRALIFQSDKPILSQVLRDAKEKGEAIEKEKERDYSVRKAQFEILFDDFCGMVHLEALEMISKQCQLKVQLLLSEANESNDDVNDINDTLESVKDLFELPNVDENVKLPIEKLKEMLDSAIDSLNVKVSLDKIELSALSEVDTSEDVSTIHRLAITHLAQFTAVSIELFHRIAEFLIVKECHSTTTESEALISLVSAFKLRVSNIAEHYSTLLTVDPSASALVTNIFLEASNCSSYLENAFELFIPILQLGAVS